MLSVIAFFAMEILFFTNCETCAYTVSSYDAPSPPCRNPHLLLPDQNLSETKEQEEKALLLVFISFNLPSATLQALIDQTTRAGGVLVVRGLVNGSFRETAKRIQELGGTIHIDPPLFERFAVQSVPTFILSEPLSREEAVTPIPHDRIAGNISLLHALTLFEEKGDLPSQAQVFRRRLKGNP